MELAREALLLAALLSAPALLASLFASALAGLASSRAQLSDPAIAHAPRVFAVTAGLALGAGWMGATLLRFTRALWDAMPALVP